MNLVRLHCVSRRHGRARSVAALVGALVLAAVATVLYTSGVLAPPESTEPPAAPPLTGEAGVKKFCAECHRFPAPEILPRGRWPREIQTMYEIAESRSPTSPLAMPPREEALKYFTSRAPERFPNMVSTAKVGPGPLQMDRISWKLQGVPPYPGVSNVQFVNLYSDEHPDLLVTEMRFGLILLVQPAKGMKEVFVLARDANRFHPARCEVVDLDKDGRRDILVADLGTPTPSDATFGRVIWLRGLADRKFETVPLATGLGRVADVRAADFDADGDLDVLVAEFGWRNVGSIFWLENRDISAGAGGFLRHSIDPRPGTIQLPIVDLNADGRPDFIALISQQFETVVAFVNQGEGFFWAETIFEAEHPNWGASGMELVDLDGDGDEDILVANGDTLDDLLLKPYHGLTWLENLGSAADTGSLKFHPHNLSPLCGAHMAKAADFDGDGDLDIVVAAFLPFLRPTDPGVEFAESLIWLKQTSPGEFVRYSIESVKCFHPTLDVADYDGDGDPDIAVGNMTMAKKDGDDLDAWVTLWRNRRK